MKAEASRNVADKIGELHALASYVHMLCMQGNTIEAEKHLLRLQEIAQTPQLTESARSDFWHAIAFYWMAQLDFVRAQQAWQESLSCADQVSFRKFTTKRHWLGLCMYKAGKLDEAKILLREVLADAIQQSYQRSAAFCRVQLASIDIDQRNSEGVVEALEVSRAHADQYQDRPCLAAIHHTTAHFHVLRNEIPAACAALAEAIDLYERLGMRRELAEARTELARLDDLGGVSAV